MKRILLGLILGWFFFGSAVAFAGVVAVPDWAYTTTNRQGNTWQFSGSVHGISLLNVAIPLARAAALSNLASAIGVGVNSQVAQSVEGSEVDGYTASIRVSQGYFFDRVRAYGVVQKKVHVQHVYDQTTGRMKFDVYVLLEVSDTDLNRAREEFSRRPVAVAPAKPIMKPKSQESWLDRMARKVGL